MVLTLKDLTVGQKEFYILILTIISSVGRNVSDKTNYAIDMCHKIGITEEEFQNKIKKVNLLMKN